MKTNVSKRNLGNCPVLRKVTRQGLWHLSCLLALTLSNSWRLGEDGQTDVQFEAAPLSSQWRIKVQIKSRLEREVVEETEANTHTHNKQTFDSWEVNAGMLMNPNAVANDPKRALLESTRACHQLKAAKRHKDMDWFFFSRLQGLLLFLLFSPKHLWCLHISNLGLILQF